MNKLYKLFIIRYSLFIISYSLFTAQAQVASDYAVMVHAFIDTLPPKITLKWTKYPSATGYTVYKKSKAATTWGYSIATPSGSDTQYIDNNVALDTAYEYAVIRTSDSITAYGYIYSGIKLHSYDYKGKLILIIDSTYSDSLSFELHRLMQDISGNGWAIIRHDVSRHDTVPFIKSLIVKDYNLDPVNTTAILLFGHVPVPYSGSINPDAHPDHLGAWPADVYYADIFGVYTDDAVDDTTGISHLNWNVPHDGKFDQGRIPSATIKLEIGRIDMANLPAFSQDENALLKQYLDKNHQFRQKFFTAPPRGLIDDNFGAFYGEAFASSGWRSFSAMFGDTAIKALDFFSTLKNNDYLWAYGCGGGSWEACSGVGATSDFAADNVNAVFTMLFGSYFGDWNCTNDFMRASLASKGKVLTSCWSGRPNWSYHHMALGENIGFTARLMQNNTGTYFYDSEEYMEYELFDHLVHIALLGDPTLTMFIVAPPSNLIKKHSKLGVTVTWTASADKVAGYYVYHSTDEFGTYSRISPLLTSTSFFDNNPLNGLSYYMVRAVKLQNTASGSYFNLSEGISDSSRFVNTKGITQLQNNNLNVYIYPNPSNGLLNLRIVASQNNDNLIVNIYDIFGRFIEQKTAHPNSKDFILPLQLTDLKNGVYMLEAKINDNSLIKRFEILR